MAVDYRIASRGQRAASVVWRARLEANVTVSMAVWRWAVVVGSALGLGAAACQPAAAARSPENTGSVVEEAAGASPAVRAGPNVVGVNCDGGNCEASCLAGSSILLAYGFHGRAHDENGRVDGEVCGQAVEWLGACLGRERCEMRTACTTSAMYLICR